MRHDNAYEIYNDPVYEGRAGLRAFRIAKMRRGDGVRTYGTFAKCSIACL